MRDRVFIKESLGQDSFRLRMSAVIHNGTQPSSPRPESNRRNTWSRTSPPASRANCPARCACHPLAGSRSPHVPTTAARPLPPQPRAGPPDRGTLAATGRSVGNSPSRSRPRCPRQTTDPSGRQTDLGLGAAGSRGRGRGPEGLRRLGPPVSPQPCGWQPRRPVSRPLPRSETRTPGRTSRPGSGTVSSGPPEGAAAVRSADQLFKRPGLGGAASSSCPASSVSGGGATAEGVRGSEVRGPSATGGRPEGSGSTWMEAAGIAGRWDDRI